MTPAYTQESWPLDRLLLDEREAKRHSPLSVSQLAKDLLARGQLQPVGAKRSGRMIFGNQRLLAAREAKLSSLLVNAYPDDLGDLDLLLIRASENVHRTELTNFKRFEIVADVLANSPGWQMKDAAAALNIDPATVTKLMSANKLVPPALAAFEADRLTLADVYALAKLPADRQPGLLNLRLTGGNHQELERAGRRQRSADKPAARLSRVRMAVNDLSLVLSGAELSLDDVAAALAEAQKEVRRCQGQGMDVRALNALQSARKAAQ